MAEDWPSYSGMLSRLDRARSALPPCINLMPKVPDGSPRFVELSHGQGAVLLGPMHEPLRIDADPNKPVSEWAGREGRPKNLTVVADISEKTIIDEIESAALETMEAVMSNADDYVREELERVGLARQKWPEELRVVDEFPRTASGKIQKFVLRERLRTGW